MLWKADLGIYSILPVLRLLCIWCSSAMVILFGWVLVIRQVVAGECITLTFALGALLCRILFIRYMACVLMGSFNSGFYGLFVLRNLMMCSTLCDCTC